ncbi:MAG TPA: adenylosuccinate synthase [Acidobacteriota bacterium]|nr:adenylosuccinate synthase [Acidobacteriota bacterium]
MPNLAVVGAQWGDEGKGKIVDLVSLHFDIVARYQGGHNAGHTVVIQGKSYILQLIPSGMFRGGKIGLIGNGVVIEPGALIREVRKMLDAGFQLDNRLHVSDRAHLILPHHLWKEREEETKQQIGTTMKGIGPCYEDKAGRRGFRIADLVRPDFTERMQALYAGRAEASEFLKQLPELQSQIGKYACNGSEFLNAAIREGKSLLFEGAQGTMLDVDHGTYPFVTSSSCAAGGISTGLGIGPKHVHKVLGVSKAYVTRVGGGPLPTELLDETGEYIRKKGKEFGAVTGRPRRCGWLDLVALRYSAQINGMDALCITKLDILDELDEIKVCVGYEVDGRQATDFPASLSLLEHCNPVYKTFPGWKCNTFALRKLEALPANAKRYIEFLEDFLQMPIAMISTSPERDDTVFYPAFDSLC